MSTRRILIFLYTVYRLVEEKENKENEEFKSGKSLSMILEASKERNSSSSSGIVSKLEQPSTIDFGTVLILKYYLIFITYIYLNDEHFDINVYNLLNFSKNIL